MSKFKFFFNNARIAKKQFIQKHTFKHTNILNKYYQKCKQSLSIKTYQFFHYLQFRLPLVLVSSHFVFNNTESISLTKKNRVSVNNKIINHLDYTLKIKDLIYLFTGFRTFTPYSKRKLISKKRF